LSKAHQHSENLALYVNEFNKLMEACGARQALQWLQYVSFTGFQLLGKIENKDFRTSEETPFSPDNMVDL